MKLKALYFLIVLLAVFSESYAQQARLTLNLKDVEIVDVLFAIEQQSDYYFFFKNDEIRQANKVNAQFQNESIERILGQILAGTNLNYKIVDRYIVIGPESPQSESNSIEIKDIRGRVVDKNGQSLPGVTIMVKGKTKGTISDVEGNYSLQGVETGATLVFSFIGMKTKEVVVYSNPNINIVLEDLTFGLDEVIAIGYGSMKKSDLTGTVASIKGSEIISYPVSSAAQALQGKIPGVTIVSIDGRPDAKVTIRVRGGGSITQSNDPLFMVDGFPVGSINDIAASQIESINILKDASSTAIYGSRGANGVVLITTKFPKGEKISVAYDGKVQVKTPSKYLGVLNGYEFARLNWEFGTLFGYGDAWEMAFGLGSKYRYLNPGGIESYKIAPFRNIEKEAIGTSFMQNHNLTLSGGSEKSKFSISIDHLDDDGLKIQSWYKRTNLLAKLQNELAKGFILNVDAYASKQEVFGNEAQINTVGSRLTQSVRFTPVTPLGDISSNNSQLGLYDNYVREQYDPINRINDIYDKTERQLYRVNASLSATILEGVTLRTEYGTSTTFGSNYLYLGAVYKNTVGVEGGDATLTKSQTSKYRLVNTINYNLNEFLGDHHLDLLVGQEITGSKGEISRIEGTRYPISFDYKKAFAMMNQYGDQSEVSISNTMSEPARMASFFGRLNYTFKERYLLTLTLRADGSSNFAPANRWGYFPAVALAWRISEEKAFKRINYIDNLKFRISYGEVGNDRISSGLWKEEWAAKANGYPYNNVGNSYYVPASTMLVNPGLRWETTITRNIGLDYAFLKNRIYGHIDTYWNTTKDLLMVNQIPAYTGYNTQMANVGQTSNKGFEFSIGSDVVRTKELKISANINIAHNKNNVDALSQEMEHFYYTSNWGSNATTPQFDYGFMVGNPIGLIRGYTYDGFYTTDDFNYNTETKEYSLKDGIANSRPALGVFPNVPSGVYPGMLKLKKLATTTHATNINETDDVSIIGDTNPKHTGGLNLSVAYKNFDLLLGFNWSYGNDIYNANKLVNSYGIKLPFRNFSESVSGWYSLFKIDASGDLVRVFNPDELASINENARQPMPFHEFAVVHTKGIEDGSFLRLNNVTFGYTLPAKSTQKLWVQKMRVYATITNVFTWTNYSGYDPEIDAGNGRNETYPTPGMDFGAYPRARAFTFGLTINF